MDLAIINTGVRVNDGTGDTPRTSWTKQNGNNALLKAGLEDVRDAAEGAVAAAAAAPGDARDALVSALPGILDQAFLTFALTRPFLPTDGTVPVAGWYRNGDANGFSFFYVAPQS